ncbi:MAG: hypothetical protein AAF221_12670 [Pseudomonadota bacterium]
MILNFLVGLVFMIIGAEAFLRGAGSLRERFAVPHFIVGLIVIGFGTSLPELAISAGATAAGFETVALGLLLGSFIVNLALLLGLCAAIKPIDLNRKVIGRDGATMVIGASYLLVGTIMKPTGLIWPIIGFAVFALYCAMTLLEERSQAGAGVMAKKAEYLRQGPSEAILAMAILILGLGAIMFGGKKLVEGSVGYAADIGVPLTVIGLALLALITSIPEAVISIHSAIKGQSDVAVANLLGSNIFNLLFVLPLCQLLMPTGQSFFAGPWTMHAFAALLVGLITYNFILGSRQLGRLDGAVFLLIYCGYIAAALYQ